MELISSLPRECLPELQTRPIISVAKNAGNSSILSTQIRGLSFRLRIAECGTNQQTADSLLQATSSERQAGAIVCAVEYLETSTLKSEIRNLKL